MNSVRDHRLRIDAEQIAAKLDRLHNHDFPEVAAEIAAEPRLAEVLWFLHFVSSENYRGGLRRFARDLIARNRDRLGTLHMAKHRTAGAAASYSLDQLAQIYADLPGWIRPELCGADAWQVELALRNRADAVGCLVPAELRAIEERMPDFVETARSRLTPAALMELCRRHAEEELAGYLVSVCEVPHIGFRPLHCPDGKERWEVTHSGAPWYFAEVADALLAFMEEHRRKAEARIGETAVTRLMNRWLSKAYQMRRTVLFIGNSRWGKTEAGSNYCQAQPGKARFVHTPAGDSEHDLIVAVANAFGLDTHGVSTRQLKASLAYLLKYSRLMPVFDEAQFIMPQKFARDTPPSRLNWLRRALMDQHIPVGLIATPQSYLRAKKRFVKVTNFAIEQFDERILKVVQLPDTLPYEELLAVARVHFPDLAHDYLEYVVRTVLATERNYVSDVEKIATLALSGAQEAGRPRPTLDDIESAMSDVLPSADPSNVSGQGSGEATKSCSRGGRRKALTPADVFPALKSSVPEVPVLDPAISPAG